MKRTHVNQAEAAGFARAFGREADAISKRAIGQDRKSDLAWRSAVSSDRINGRALRVWRNAGEKFVMHFDGANTAAMIRSGLAAASKRGSTAEDALLHWVTAPPKVCAESLAQGRSRRCEVTLRPKALQGVSLILKARNNI